MSIEDDKRDRVGKTSEVFIPAEKLNNAIHNFSKKKRGNITAGIRNHITAPALYFMISLGSEGYKKMRLAIPSALMRDFQDADSKS